jgi:hypothetical protein
MGKRLAAIALLLSVAVLPGIAVGFLTRDTCQFQPFPCIWSARFCDPFSSALNGVSALRGTAATLFVIALVLLMAIFFGVVRNRAWSFFLVGVSCVAGALAFWQSQEILFRYQRLFINVPEGHSTPASVTVEGYLASVNQLAVAATIGAFVAAGVALVLLIASSFLLSNSLPRMGHPNPAVA